MPIECYEGGNSIPSRSYYSEVNYVNVLRFNIEYPSKKQQLNFVSIETESAISQNFADAMSASREVLMKCLVEMLLATADGMLKDMHRHQW